MRRIVKVSAVGVALLSPWAASAQEWNPALPLWEQAEGVVCRETSRYECSTERTCQPTSGHAVFTFDFEANRLEFAEGNARQDIKGYAFRKTIQRNNPTMSLLMEDGRMCRFSFVPDGPAGKFKLRAHIIEYADFGGGLTVIRLECTRR